MIFPTVWFLSSVHRASNNCVAIQGFNETLTEQITDQIANAKLKLNPELKEPLKTLCDDEDTTVIVVSGYDKIILSEVIS
jgi:trehalose 6-phosphate synthase/phosphatase